MFNLFKKKLEKRQTYFYSLGRSLTGGVESNQSDVGGLPSVRRALSLYRDLLLCSPIFVEDNKGNRIDSPALNIIKKPNNFMTQSEFYQLLVQDYFLSGNFISLIQADNSGQVTALLPFQPGSIWCYPKSDSGNKNANNSDPIFLNRPGAIYYLYSYDTGRRDQNDKPIKATSSFASEDIMHLRSQWGNRGDYLNGSGIFSTYSDAFTMGIETIKTGANIATNGLLPQSLISGVETDSPEKTQELEVALNQFTDSKKMFLTLPESSDIKPLMNNRPEGLFSILSSVSSLNVARIFNLPIDLLSREDGGQSQGGQNLKESFRYFTKVAGKSFLRMCASKFSEILPQGQHFRYLTKGTQASDLRELSMSLKQMVEDKILTKEQASDWLEDV